MNRLATLAAAGVGAYWLYRALKPGYDFGGKNVLITGGSRGLGLVLARELVGRGARVAICSRDPDELKAAYDDLAGRGGRVVAVECDVTDREQIRRFVAAARQRLGPVDVLVNNAGIIGVGPLDTQTVADFERALQVHLWASLYAVLEVLPEMRARRAGRIVNIASFGGKVAVPHLVPYCVSKFAQVGLSDGLRAELAADGITVTTVCPGLMRTGSHINAEFKGRHEEEYAWFALGNAIPGMSMTAERAARQILRAVALGDAEIVLTLPAKLAVVARNVAPNLFQSVTELVNKLALPKPGGIGTDKVKGYASRGKLPEAVTVLSDRAAKENNEIRPTLPSDAGTR
jgi:NAD(P)-dependent dehydrogenase (short-subunit alcohol dehydrogenase family)